MAPWSALPAHINEPHEWKGTDHDQWWGSRWILNIKGWLAFGPRAKEKWARWRKTPRLLFAYFGSGVSRLESHKVGECTASPGLWYWKNDISKPRLGCYYVSRCQYWCRWHVAVQWPLQITAHVYWWEKDVPKYPNKPKKMSWRKMLFAYGPIHFDADKVYWVFSFFLGGRWK